ncbi:MAG: tetratricopeptide repeat protein [Acidobacteriaceae bacterium]|nr:tetratricopeptide repeat protein [Acidobacteriaceae bacterium]
MPPRLRISSTTIAVFAAAVGVFSPASARTPDQWILVRSSHFDLYAQTTDNKSVRAALEWFERLYTFFSQETGLPLEGRSVRVIAFRSEREYQPYRLGPLAHAYYIGTGDRDCIVLPRLGNNEFATAGHEYAHLVLHATGRRLPSWLDEGLADFFSTVRISKTGASIGGELPAHTQSLRRLAWMELPRMFSIMHDDVRDDRALAEVFYSESWALTHMLMLSPEYAPRFHDVVERIASGAPSEEALVNVYGRNLGIIKRDLHRWIEDHARAQADFGEIPNGADPALRSRAVTAFESREILAQLLLGIGELDRAQAAYRELAKQEPEHGTVYAALGEIAVRKHEYASARDQLKRALEKGVGDAALCYRFASLADSVEIPEQDLQRALERAVALKPDFDDARYSLALLESDSGDFEGAVEQLRAMRVVSPARAFDYWSSLSYALNELGRFDEAMSAANKAKQQASTPLQRTRADELAYIAQTDLTVRFAKDSNGNLQLITARVPHNSHDWNPFIEPEDHIRLLEGTLDEIQCTANRAVGVTLNTGREKLRLSIPDPQRIQIRNGPSEFLCGPQSAPASVTVEYAAGPGEDNTGAVRGITFRPDSGASKHTAR